MGFSLPDEVAVKTITWKLSATAYENTEWSLLEAKYDLKHDNLVQIFYLSTEVTKKNLRKQQIYMEVCDEALNEFTENEDVSVADIKYVLYGVLKGLNHLHQQGIIHRDIKPQNILLKKPNAESSRIQEMVIKLADYNICQSVPLEDTSATLTNGMGSQGYRAPEVLLSQDSGKTRYGTPADIWSVGALLFQLRTKDAFSSEHDIRSGALEIEERIKTVPEEKFQTFLGKCLKMTPGYRKTAQELLMFLRAD